jgi:uncharacterized membrane protein YccC
MAEIAVVIVAAFVAAAVAYLWPLLRLMFLRWRIARTLRQMRREMER